MQRLRKKIMSMNNERTRTGMNYEEDTITIVENPVVEVANTFDSKVMEISRRKEVEQEVINEVKQEMLAEAEEEAKLKQEEANAKVKLNLEEANAKVKVEEENVKVAEGEAQDKQ